jgi:hypothetical protein
LLGLLAIEQAWACSGLGRLDLSGILYVVWLDSNRNSNGFVARCFAGVFAVLRYLYSHGIRGHQQKTGIGPAVRSGLPGAAPGGGAGAEGALVSDEQGAPAGGAEGLP